MQITNGSAGLIDKKKIEVSDSNILIGEHPGVDVGTGVMFLFVIAGFFLPGSWLAYWSAGLMLAIVSVFNTPDDRKKYIPSEIEAMSILGTDRVGTKGAGGSLGGAAVGAIAFGGVGAIVGSVAGGNKIDEFTNLVIKFTDGEWVTITSKSGLVADIQYQRLVKMAGPRNQCPI